MSLRPPKRVKDLLMVNWNIFWISLRYFCWISRAQMCMEWMDAHLKFLFAVTKYQKELVKILCGRRSHHWLNSGGRKEVQDTRQGTRMAVDAVVASIKRRAQTITTFEDIAEVHVRSFHSCISFILSIFYLFWPFSFSFSFSNEVWNSSSKSWQRDWWTHSQGFWEWLRKRSSVFGCKFLLEFFPFFTFYLLRLWTCFYFSVFSILFIKFFFPDWFAMFYLWLFYFRFDLSFFYENELFFCYLQGACCLFMVLSNDSSSVFF